MQKTTNYNLNVVELNDAPPDITKISENFPIIDAILKDHEDLFGSYVPLASVKSKGNATTPIYFDANGVAQATTYSLNKTVPADAKFTDTLATATTNGEGNAVTSITASNGVVNAIKGNSFLPLSGGQMSGQIKRNNDTSSLDIVGGTDYATSASLALEGKNNSSFAGRFFLGTGNNTSNGAKKYLSGDPDGGLYWDNNPVVCSTRVSYIGTGWHQSVIKYSDGIQIVHGSSTTISGTYTNVSYSAFTGVPQIYVTSKSADENDYARWYASTSYETTTGFRILSSINDTKAVVDYLCIGRWK